MIPVGSAPEQLTRLASGWAAPLRLRIDPRAPRICAFRLLCGRVRGQIDDLTVWGCSWQSLKAMAAYRTWQLGVLPFDRADGILSLDNPPSFHLPLTKRPQTIHHP